ncbi:MAG: tRNA (N6-isopentenyl adenosine(37)-C2)-methylthiotransferase MiaB [Verrucomicrobiales bacterium]
MPTVYIKTYGCQMNERDSEQVGEMFIERGYTLTRREDDADVILINTCSVRDQAEQKALGKMGLMGRHRRRKPHLVYGFMGCMAQSRGSELFGTIPHLDLVVGTQKYHRVVDHVDTIVRAREEAEMDDLRFAITDTEEEAGSQNTIRDHEITDGQATAFVSIMQGCNMKCSFCIVPYTRGAERSRPITDIVHEVRGLADCGVKEVTLLGQIVNLYGRTEFERMDGKSPFVQLLEAVHEVGGIERIRFTSPHPIGYREDLVAAFTYLPKLCPHIHFPMQSGSDRVLKLMRRPYKAEKFLEICNQMKAARKGLAITTDIIVGFPGETEEDYLATRAMVETIGFDNAFIFRYSTRRGTPASDFEEQVPERIKEERNQDLLALVNRLAIARNSALVGSVQEVLCEGPSKTNKERLTGRTPHNKPVILDGPPHLRGKIFPVAIRETTGFTLYGDVL